LKNYSALLIIINFLNCFLVTPDKIFAEKTDIVLMENGDRLTGEVKKLELGMLSFKTDHMGTISIEWDKVVGIWAMKKYFRLEREDGFLLYGSIESDTAYQKILVALDTIKIPLYFWEVVRITPIEMTFWERLDGSLDIGYSYTKATTVSQLSLSGEVIYRSYRKQYELDWSAIHTSQDEQANTMRRDVSLLAKRLYQNKNFFQVIGEMQQNSELGLDLRLALGGGVGKNLIQNNQAVLLSGGGLSFNREWTDNYSSSINNLEGFIGTGYNHFIYDHPQLNLDGSMQIYPSITDWGRIRMELDVQLKWEIIKDLYWSLTYYDSYDNRPPGEEISKNDFSIVLSLGYTF
jgi:Protein of unknown function, DUF481